MEQENNLDPPDSEIGPPSAMPKSKRKKGKSVYFDENLILAIEAVRSKKMSQREASRHFEIV